MPVELTFGRKRGVCRKMVDSRMCGVEFVGPPNQKYCKEHSEHQSKQKYKPRRVGKKL